MDELNKNKSVNNLLNLGDVVNIEGEPFGFNGDEYTLYRKTPISLEFIKNHINHTFYYLRINSVGCSFENNKLKIPSYCFLELDLKNEIPENKLFLQDSSKTPIESEVIYYG